MFSTDALVASGTATSAAVDCGQVYRLKGIYVPAWTSAGIAFTTSTTSGGTYLPVCNKSGTEYAITAGTGAKFFTVDAEFFHCQYIKVVSGTTGSTVNQGADRTVTLVFEDD